jgi:transmembrane sensor
MIRGMDIAASEAADRETRIGEQAAHWLEAIERTLRPAESTALREWLKVSAHRDAIVSRCKLWHGPEVLAVLGELVPVDSMSERVERQYGRLVLAMFLGVSGIGFATVVIAVSKILPGSDSNGNPLRAEANVQTAADTHRVIRLPDGGTMRLGGGTQVLVSYGPHARDITMLRGEATFDVIEDAERAFRVHVSPRQFVVEHAAHFAVRRLEPELIQLTVATGEVIAPQSRRRTPLPPALIRSRVDSGEHTFVATEGGTLGVGWQVVEKLSPQEVTARLAVQ